MNARGDSVARARRNSVRAGIHFYATALRQDNLLMVAPNSSALATVSRQKYERSDVA
jgi:hypothetical protein